MICDWITIHQVFDKPILNNLSGKKFLVVETDTGKVIEEKYQPADVEGSYSTNIRIAVNKNRLSVSGNVGRFGRPDNFCGYSLDKVKLLVNEILSSLELPTFCSGKFLTVHNGKGETIKVYTGATISRVDICTNWSADRRPDHFIHEISRFKIGRRKPEIKKHGLYWSSAREVSKVYNKGQELLDNNKSNLVFVRKLGEWLIDNNVVRHETKYTEKFLNREGLKPWCKCTSSKLNSYYVEEVKFMLEQRETVELMDMPSHLMGTYYVYISGGNMDKLSRSTRYRHRKELLKFGVDILVSNSNLRHIGSKKEVVSCSSFEIPEFYLDFYSSENMDTDSFVPTPLVLVN